MALSFSTQQPQQFQPQFQQNTLLFPQQQQHQQQQHQQLYLFTNDKAPANYSTKWADLHPDSQKCLLQIEERILEYRDESWRLDQCGRLYDSSVSNEGFELDASHIIQELGGISTAMERQKAFLHELMGNVKDMLRNTEVAVRSFIMLHPRFIHQKVGGASSATAPSQASAVATSGSSGQQAAASIVPVYDFYYGLPKKPSPFLQQTISRFEKKLSEFRLWVQEIEQLLLPDSDRNGSNPASLLQSLPSVMTNVHGFFVHVAAKVENIHQYIESMRTAYLTDQRHRGDGNNPFLEANRRETARLEAAAKRVHPTLHLPPTPSTQPSTQVAGLLASSSTPAQSTAVPTFGGASAASSGGGFGLFSGSSLALSMSSPSLFATPSTSAPASSLFGSSGASPQTSLFGSASTPSLFNTAASTPSFFNTTASSFVSPAPAGPGLFGTPFGSGPSTTSGSSFGAATKSSRPKSRTTRR